MWRSWLPCASCRVAESEQNYKGVSEVISNFSQDAAVEFSIEFNCPRSEMHPNYSKVLRSKTYCGNLVA